MRKIATAVFNLSIPSYARIALISIFRSLALVSFVKGVSVREIAGKPGTITSTKSS